MNWETEQEDVDQLRSRLEHLGRKMQEDCDNLALAKRELIHASQAQEFLQYMAQLVQQHSHKRIASIVTSCLRLVFGEEAYEFHIEFLRKRGRTEASFQFRKDGMILDPLTSSGGGMIDVAAFALRISCLMLHRPRLRRLLILDEPFKFVSAEYRDNVRQMLEGLSKDLGLQIIMVTHDPAYETGKVYRL